MSALMDEPLQSLKSTLGIAKVAPPLPSLGSTPPLSPSLKATHVSDEHLLLASELLAESGEEGIVLDGYKLTLGSVVRIGRGGEKVKIDKSGNVQQRIDESVQFLASKVSLSDCDLWVWKCLGGVYATWAPHSRRRARG